MSRPLATFFLATYQQEPYVREAVRSALAQDYEPLEIFISDDCSTDRTFEIIQEECAAYRGPHSIRLNKNSENMGVANHTNMIMQQVNGEFTLIACGDDLFEKNRTSIIMEVWEKHRTPVITSNAYRIDVNGNLLGLAKDPKQQYDLSLEYFAKTGVNAACYGAAMAIQTALFREFGPMDTSWSPYNGDHIMPFWGLLKGGGNAFIHEPLVYHRITPGSDSFKNHSVSTTNVEREESLLAHHIAQNMYIIDTLSRYMMENNLLNDTRFVNIHRLINERVYQQVAHWVKTRNKIKLEGKQCHWLPLSA